MQPTVQDIAAALGRPALLSAAVVEAGQNNLVLDAGDLIVRVPRHDRAEGDLMREARILAALAPHLPLPVPAPVLYRVGDRTVSAHSRLPGAPLMSVAELDDARLRDLAGFLSALHRLPPALLVPDTAPADPLAEWRDMLGRAEAQALPLLPQHRGDGIRARFHGFLSAGHDLPTTIIHGDFGTGNILADGGRVSGVIDFAGCGIGDPAYDFASLSAGLGDGILRRMAPHYPGIDGMRDRIGFYRGTFALMDVLFGLDHGDDEALQDGLAALTA